MWLFFLLFPTFVLSLTISQQNLIINVAQKLKVRQCILEKRGPPLKSELFLIKGLSNTNVSSSYWSPDNIFEFFWGSEQIFRFGPEFFARPLTLVVISSELFEKVFPLRSDLRMSSLMVDDYKRYNTAWYQWLVFWPHDGPVPTSVAFIPYDAFVLIAYWNLTALSYTIHSVYSVHNTSFDIEWGYSNGTKLHFAVTPSPRPLNGAIIRRQYLNPEAYKTHSRLLYPHQEMFVEIGKLLNTSFSLVRGTDVDYHKYDMTDTMSLMTSDGRVGIVGPTLKLKLNLFIKGLGENSLDSYFIHPFDRNLWIAIVSWISIAMMVVTIIESRKIDKPARRYLEGICGVLEAFCYQGGSLDDATLAARMARISTWITACIVIPSYIAVVISFMTAQQAYVPFKDISGLASDGRYVLSGDRGMVMLLVVANDKDTRDIVAKFLVPEDELPYSINHAAEKICSDRHAYINFNELIREIPAPCDIIKVEKTIMELHAGLALKLFSPLRRVFLKKLTPFLSNGMMSRFQRNLDKAPVPRDSQDVLPVKLELVRALLNILIYAVPAAMLVCLVEILSIKALSKRQRKVKKDSSNI